MCSSSAPSAAMAAAASGRAAACLTRVTTLLAKRVSWLLVCCALAFAALFTVLCRCTAMGRSAPACVVRMGP